MVIMVCGNGGGDSNAQTDDPFSRNLMDEHVINLIRSNSCKVDKKETMVLVGTKEKKWKEDTVQTPQQQHSCCQNNNFEQQHQQLTHQL